MYSDQLRTLKRAYSNARKTNESFLETSKNVQRYTAQLNYISGLSAGLKVLSKIISEQEEQWQHIVLRRLEAEIMSCLSYIYKDDGYRVDLSARVLRGKVHIEASVKSFFAGDMGGDVADSQGRLFQQLVSFASLIGLMKILGVNTVYVDEAFSGASKSNIAKINTLLRELKTQGLNIIMIAQDTSMASGIEANTLLLDRSIDNKTSIKQVHGGI